MKARGICQKWGSSYRWFAESSKCSWSNTETCSQVVEGKELTYPLTGTAREQKIKKQIEFVHSTQSKTIKKDWPLT